MSRNVGIFDAALRTILGLVVIGWGLYTKNEWSAVGFVPLLTGLFGWCPLYLPFGLSTNRAS